MQRRIFGEKQRRKVLLSKHTRWAADLSFDQIQGLLLAIGEISARGRWMLAALDNAVPRDDDEILLTPDRRRQDHLLLSRRRPWAVLRLLVACKQSGRFLGCGEMSDMILALSHSPTGERLPDELRERLKRVVPLLEDRPK